MFWMKIDVCPKLYSAPPQTHVIDLQVKVTDFDFFMLKFGVIAFEIHI